MYTVYFDSGTTNTRAYLLRGGALAAQKNAAVGSRDAALAGDTTLLPRALHQLYLDLLAENGLADTDVTDIYMSGMVSSPSGIREVQHLSTPVTLADLRKGVVCHNETLCFKRDIHIIPGIKTVPKETDPMLAFPGMNNMRGEETEIFGILAGGKAPEGACVIMLPGSHTQLALVENGAVTDIVSTVTGELYTAIRQETIIGSSLAPKQCEIDADMVQLGYRHLKQYGFNRAVYMVRTLELFTGATPMQRSSYFEGVLNGGVVDIAMDMAGACGAKLAVAGSKAQHTALQAIAGAAAPGQALLHIPQNSEAPHTIAGVCAIGGQE